MLILQLMFSTKKNHTHKAIYSEITNLSKTYDNKAQLFRKKCVTLIP